MKLVLQSISFSILILISLLLTSCIDEEVLPVDKISLDEVPLPAEISSKPEWKAFRIFGAESEVSFDFNSASINNRNEGIQTFAGMVDTQQALMTKGAFGDIYSFPIIPKQYSPTSLWNLVLTINQGGTRNWHIRNYEGEFSTSLSEFTGVIWHYELSGELVMERHFLNGRLVDNSNGKNLRISSNCYWESVTESANVCGTGGEPKSFKRIDTECSDVSFETAIYRCDDTESSGSSEGGGGYYQTPAGQPVPISPITVSPEVIEALAIHQDLLNRFPQLSGEQINVEQIVNIYTLDAYKAAATFYEAYAQEVGQSPTDPYQWQLMMEEFAQDLGPLLLELIPGGVGDLIGAYNDFSNGNYFMGSLGIVMAAVPVNEVFKVVQKGDSIRKAFQKVYKIVVVWNRLSGVPGGQRVISKIPKAWRDLPGSKLASNWNGLAWKLNPQNEFRLMEAVSNTHIVNKTVPYARLNKNGKFLGVNNKLVYKANDKYYEEGVEITLQQFEEFSHVPISNLTDDILNKFFDL